MEHRRLTLAVLGDSIAFGTGATHPGDALGPRLVRVLADAGIDCELAVHAVPGAVSADLDAQVRRAGSPDLALVVIGANDLSRLVPPSSAAAQLGTAVRRLRERGADVLVVPAPDMSSIPWVPQQFRALVRVASDELHRRQTAAVQAAGGVVAPIAGELASRFSAQPTLFGTDRFHPSSSGYALIAEALTPIVLSIARTRAAA
ncbi:SGNH/GDSL hydrolase family protein [Modestobacter sp. I12A-02628]|uniref:SGNH/GDSL hydrolase family protein n=1 Tax=Goekera deserti TaxID=2497753 RepID=A0A7K3WJE2_9ACTN|nr:SGNH/GDSL hydrolase family protein [Goekera deserti]MPQ99989.1 SGNH/GDSL hydrolase family protein [Goekera deserti]NDI49768.1 SGNH/GDSL hydrolase family protein [Goekera deserti]NEL56618.1 SGNH/GDSL hydrolase family protein [Goekera deserti]